MTKENKINKAKVNPVRQNLENEIARRGIKMVKLISEGSSGFFYYKPATYDKRTVYSREQLYKLSNEGFLVDDNHVEFLILDAILKL